MKDERMKEERFLERKIGRVLYVVKEMKKQRLKEQKSNQSLTKNECRE
jgi:hypothetical protein